MMSRTEDTVLDKPLWCRASAPDFQRQAYLGYATAQLPGVVSPTEDSPLEEYLQRFQYTPRDEISALLKTHGGAVLFRNFKVASAQDFSDFAHSLGLGPQPHSEVGRPPRRTVLAKGVSTANEGPPDSPIWVHNEYGWSIIYPSYILFYAFRAPDIDGQDVVKGDAEEEIRRKIELQIRKHSHDFQWFPDGSVSVTHQVPAIRRHQPTNQTVFFGNVISAYERARYHHALEPPHLGRDGAYHPAPTYGDGSPIDLGHLEGAAKIVDGIRSLVKWKDGDVLVLDNRSVQHARMPWQGERKILASLWDGEVFDDEL